MAFGFPARWPFTTSRGGVGRQEVRPKHPFGSDTCSRRQRFTRANWPPQPRRRNIPPALRFTASISAGAAEEGARRRDSGGQDWFSRFPGLRILNDRVRSLGLLGDWEELEGNHVLRPPADLYYNPRVSPADGAVEDLPLPRAVLHFLGGAFLGAAPQLTYRWLLERLAERGFVVVATPYRLSFDHLSAMDSILARFAPAAESIALDYGGLPVIGIGHSLGALLHVIAGSFFWEADGKRAANVLIAVNNRSVDDAIPLYRAVISPLLVELGKTQRGNGALETMFVDLPNSLDAITDSFVEAFALPAVRETVYPLLRQARSIFRQIPPLLGEVAEGANAFLPNPRELVRAIETEYRVQHTLMISFRNDPLDDTAQIEDVIGERSSMRRSHLQGTHLTPCSQDWSAWSNTKRPQSENGVWRSDRRTTIQESISNQLKMVAFREALALEQAIVNYVDEILPDL
ncbi:hypothetical protein CDCA_CDCA03G1007 [Cyanidium caldarium]|uniref:AB hydrolase-1 domain-containing protein n=1 Tax=Cyanidium caldarium TaxID=2771 RepID=A0AAV9IRV7_CYACA|nr:hypothetical protein CDCA_CDCA03G1007 [Cyanidium caldarium]